MTGSPIVGYRRAIPFWTRCCRKNARKRNVSSCIVGAQRMINSKDHLADRHPDAASHIDPAAPPVPHFPRLRALALFGRRSPQRVDSLVMPASENLHKSGRLVEPC
jgi:hypothetical protein